MRLFWIRFTAWELLIRRLQAKPWQKKRNCYLLPDLQLSSSYCWKHLSRTRFFAVTTRGNLFVNTVVNAAMQKFQKSQCRYLLNAFRLAVLHLHHNYPILTCKCGQWVLLWEIYDMFNNGYNQNGWNIYGNLVTLWFNTFNLYYIFIFPFEIVVTNDVLDSWEIF